MTEIEEKQHIAIFTTASLPWMTGTSVNPLFRAAYLAKDGERNITLVIPWLKKDDQERVFPDGMVFNSTTEQEKFVREWVEARTGFSSNFTIRFYPGKFDLEKRSILALGDLTEVIPDDEVDVAVLEEPEHLTWYHHGKRWKKRFCYVVGIVHTNYVEYVRREKNGLQAMVVELMNRWVVNIYCHQVIRLSAATQELSRSVVCNVHGVNPKFLEIGARKLEQQKNGDQAFTKGAYYIGKMIWSKGYRELLKLLEDHQKELAGLEVDLYGSGEDSSEIHEAAKKLDITVNVHPGRDHGDPVFHDYKVLLNPSTTDVVCTTSAEALAMGKIVVCADHSSNEFFKQFPNCKTYVHGEGFVKATCMSLSDQPLMLTDAQTHELSWEAATQRFLKVSELDKMPGKKTVKPPPSKGFLSTSLSLPRSLEDASAIVHFMGTAIVGSQPDSQQQKDLGLSPSPSGRWRISSKRWRTES